MAQDPDLIALGAVIRVLRVERRYSQERLAELSGLHTNYIGGIERGRRNVGIKAILRIAEGLGVRPSRLFEWKS